ncbi:cysteine desulfurase family protein [Lutimonas sp.]|uniref:cysteine desulfurase family protein n=1 Tax=Lutimonas sp. TaxID=1872403 RepID=UPI003D9AFD0D
MQKIYLDNAATTPLDPQVIDVMTDHMKSNFGNPSSSHDFGRKAKAIVELTRKNVAKYLNCLASEVIFTAGGSEADNLVLFNAVKNLGVQRIISSAIEHHAVLHTIKVLHKDNGIETVFVKVTSDGEVDYNDLEEKLKSSNLKTLVSLMHVNNELGNILDMERVSSLCKESNALFHSDTVQAIGHVPLDLKKTPIDFVAASAHKFHGPKGVGFAVVKKGLVIKPILHGGEQEMGSRAGTENTHSIAGMNKALSLAMENYDADKIHLIQLKEYFIEQISSHIPGIAFNGRSADIKNSAPHILSVRFPTEKPMLLFNLDLKGIAASGGSACQSGSSKGSHVLSAILTEKEAKQTSVRFSFSRFNTKEEIDQVILELMHIFK